MLLQLKTIEIRLNWTLKGSFLLLVATALSFFLSPSPRLIIKWAWMYFSVFIIIIAVSIENNRHLTKKGISNALSLSLVFPVLYGFLQFNGVDFFDWNLSDRSGRGEIFSSLGNVNWLANYLAISIPLIISELINQKKWIRKTTGILLIFSVLLLFLTRSRGAILAFAAGFSILLFITDKIVLRKKIIIVIIFFLLFASMEFFLYSNNKYTLTKRIFNSNGIKDRLFIWKVSLPLALKSLPFGAGPGNFSFLYPEELKKHLEIDDENSKRYSVHADQTHNDLLQIIIELGPLGLFAFFILSFKSFYYGIKNSGHSFQLSAVSIFIFIIISLFGFPFSQPASFLLLFLAGYFIFSDSEHGIFKPSNWHFSIWCIVSILIIVFFIKGILMVSLSSIYLNNAKKIMKTGKREKLIENLKLSQDYFPGNGEASYLLGSCYLKDNKNLKALKYLQNSSEHMIEPGIFYNMGLALSNIKKYDNASKYFRKAIELDPFSPDYPRSLSELGRIRIIRGEIDQGAAMIFRAYQIDKSIYLAVPEVMDYLNRRDKTNLALAYGEKYLSSEKNIPVNVKTAVIAKSSDILLKNDLIKKAAEIYISLDNLCEEQEFINLKNELLLDEILIKSETDSNLLLLLESKLKYIIVKNLLFK